MRSSPVLAISGQAGRQATTLEATAQDRANRFQRLAAMSGEDAPRVETLLAAPGTSAADRTGPVPVVHVVFAERVFFDFDSDQPRPDARPVLQLVADNMQRDAPDAVLTVLGHTDAVGSTEYNVALSKRRAEAVLQELIRDRVDPGQLSAVAIGKAQPIASNATEDGRGRNRRVEFLISPSLAANLDVVRGQPVEAAFLDPDELTAPRRAAVYQPSAATPDAGLRTLDEVELRAPVGSAVARMPAGRPSGLAVAAPAPNRRRPDSAPRPTLNTPERYQKRELSPDLTY